MKLSLAQEEHERPQTFLNLRKVAQISGPAIISHPEYYSYTMDEDAWWRMDLYPQVLEEMSGEGQLEGFDMVEPEVATREEVELAHEPEYVNTVLGETVIEKKEWQETKPTIYLTMHGPEDGLHRTIEDSFVRYGLLPLKDEIKDQFNIIRWARGEPGAIEIYFEIEQGRDEAIPIFEELINTWNENWETQSREKFMEQYGEARFDEQMGFMEMSVGEENVSFIQDYPTDHPKYVWSGGPWDESARAAVMRAAGGMIRANEEALGRGMSIQMYDAFHHAMPEYGANVCVINDVAMAALKYSEMGYRVMVVDVDIHQGNGTAVCTEGDPNIYTLSTHEFFDIKAESSLDIQLAFGITDDEYLTLLRNGIEKALSEFGKPDLVMYVAGTDMYGGDQLSHTQVTTEGIRVRDELVFKIFGEMGVPVATSIPQGYAENPEDTARLIKNTVLEVKKGWDEYYQGYRRTATSSDNDKISLVLC